jgi:hypothetical protein
MFSNINVWEGTERQPKIKRIMANYRLRGRALINGVVGKDFEVIVPLSTDTGSQIKIDAIKRIHPDWKEIVVSSWERV